MNTSQQKVQLIFGAGPLGRAIAHYLSAQGKPVRMVKRGKAVELPLGVELVTGDATDPRFTQQVCQNAEVIYHCAGPRYRFKDWATEFPPLQQGILAGAIASGAKLIYGDSLYGYGAVQGPMHEALPYAATTNKGKMRAQLAETLMSAYRAGKAKVVIARAADFYGEGVLNSVLGARVFIPAIQGKTAEAIGNLDLPHTYTYIGDLAKAMVILGEHEAAIGQVWHVPNAKTISTREMLNLLFAELNLPPKMNGMGKWMMRMGGLFIPEAAESIEMMYQFERPFIVDSSKFVKAFGDISTPHREALRKTIVWYRHYLQAETEQEKEKFIGDRDYATK
ncbi:NAD-dependent epimerase/dehydratase family protein [Leptothoe sp. PORK10 BA2]|uniref:NAD-dependent epimerase/dehydratase family protein n=1 Tax=Leptothoe sp. PORK10 BA2 TaxID=3110254 RepID=UPI002B20F07D|nr:NAD-dependent epimerase/dehydratase family protein [Leptothoe sp. PORK10 BA2]MEA5467150.1 NAD-dependent epimerase/dehydratase family protein [Leptothoe sp. PORK10 BA2]